MGEKREEKLRNNESKHYQGSMPNKVVHFKLTRASVPNYEDVIAFLFSNLPIYLFRHASTCGTNIVHYFTYKKNKSKTENRYTINRPCFHFLQYQNRICFARKSFMDTTTN